MGSIGLCSYANYILISKHDILPWWLLGTMILCIVVGVSGSQIALNFATQICQRSDRIRNRFTRLVIPIVKRKLFLREMKSLREIKLLLGFHRVRFMKVDTIMKGEFLSNIVEFTANALLL